MLKKKKVTADAAEVSSRGRGALLGLAVGDALGAPLEGKRLLSPLFPALCNGPYKDMTGGGPLALKPGQVTDDTQMASIVAASLRTHRRYEISDVTKRLVQWRQVAVGMDEQVLQVLDALTNGGLPAQAPARYVWIQSGRKAASNSCVSRGIPIGVYFSDDQDECVKASLLDSSLTHVDPYCQLASAGVNGALGVAIRSPTEPTPLQMAEGAVSAITLASVHLSKVAIDSVRDVLARDVQSAARDLEKDLRMSADPNPMLFGPELHMHNNPTFVRVAFRLAFWELFHAPSFDAGMIDVINRGGDTDGNAAISGALLGARFGMGQIPERWRRGVLEALSNARAGPLYDLYHPRVLVTLVDA